MLYLKCTTILDTSLKLSNKLVLYAINFKSQWMSEIWFKIKRLMNIYTKKSVFNNWQMQYELIVPQNSSIVIKYVYSLNSETFCKCWSEATSCSKGLKYRTSWKMIWHTIKKSINIPTFYQIKLVITFLIDCTPKNY